MRKYVCIKNHYDNEMKALRRPDQVVEEDKIGEVCLKAYYRPMAGGIKESAVKESRGNRARKPVEEVPEEKEE